MGEPERGLALAVGAASDAVLVGSGTVLNDDPQLTVRLVPGASPLRVVLDSTLRSPTQAQIFSLDAATLVLTTAAADQGRAAALSERAVAVRAVPAAPGGVDLAAALALLREQAVRTVLVEGGARVITALLAARLVDRLVVSVSPRLIGTGVEAVGALGITRISDGIGLRDRSVFPVGDDVVIAGDVT
jgi:riboflavin-specific deaminase-like protein